MLAQGWRLQSYRRNPVFLWAHDYTRPVIGRAHCRCGVSRGSCWPAWSSRPRTFAREVASLYRSGYQQGVSVGFKPLRYEESVGRSGPGAFLGIRFLEQELLEVSAVPVPANREALRRGFSEEPVRFDKPGDERYNRSAMESSLERLQGERIPSRARPGVSEQEWSLDDVLKRRCGRPGSSPDHFSWCQRGAREISQSKRTPAQVFSNTQWRNKYDSWQRRIWNIIRREVAGIRDFYQARMDAELPPLQEEVGRIVSPAGPGAGAVARRRERRAILAKFGGDDRPQG